jgi:signal transduction histidine kinase
VVREETREQTPSEKAGLLDTAPGLSTVPIVEAGTCACSRNRSPMPAGVASHELRTPLALLSEFFEDLQRDLPPFGERDFRLQAVDGTLPADPDRLMQVLRNLLRNAVAHAEPGDQVLVSTRALNGNLEICVSDSGPGIPPDQLEYIFERCRRLDGSRSRDTGGSGLGLAIARAITEAHGGSIRAESGRGQGATFRIDLPGYRAPQSLADEPPDAR